MQTITLELLRHGPAHNQLLSPLTPYLALCENHAAVTLNLPFEHNQFLHRLSALGYKLGDEPRIFQLQDTASVLGNLLAAVPGLTAETNRSDSSIQQLTHLRLILSASELALLPFELAFSPPGLPGAGQYLLLQPQMPICLTREIRRTPGKKLPWPAVPRILFVAAAPPQVGSIPLEAHLLTLRALVEPWMRYYDINDREMFKKRLEEHLVFLPNASIEAIETACSNNTFTHVHILAHGLEKQENYDTRFYLALHDSNDPNKTDYISGSRLATALRPSQRPDSGELARPAVVTLASCDSGNTGSVAGAGSSIAHALHESGIPIVVAGQFPLSFEGSVTLVDCLYSGLLWGVDPRPLLYDLRRRLYSRFPDKHDWASLVAYVSLSPDFDQQLADIKIQQAMRSIEAAMNYGDQVTAGLNKDISDARDPSKGSASQPVDVLLDSATIKMKQAKGKLEQLLSILPSKRTRILSLLASTEKRQAEIIFSSTQSIVNNEEKRNYDKKEFKDLLLKSRDHYWDTFIGDRTDSWPLVQYLSLTLIIRKSNQFSEIEKNSVEVNALNDKPERNLNLLWSRSKILSLFDLENEDKEKVIWAYGNLIELYLLRMILTDNDNDLPGEEEAKQKAVEYTIALIDLAGRASFSVYSTRRQIYRYVGWFSKISDIAPLTGLAEKIFNLFPGNVEKAWK